ncbi:MAG: glycosyltransferase family 2 protein, partial [Candidatus Hodarchaeota archaeon]
MSDYIKGNPSCPGLYYQILQQEAFGVNKDDDFSNNIYDCLKMDSITHIILPAYNEEASLPNLLARLETLQRESNARILTWVVDDGSIDNTANIVLKGSFGLDVRLVSHMTNLGLGQALMTGINSVLEVSGDNDIVIVMDADDTHDVNLIIPMRREIESGADIVIASRFVPGGDHSTAPIFRRLLSRGAAFTFKNILPINNVRDFTSGYRAYKASILSRTRQYWGERLIEEQGFACMVELLLKLRHFNPVIQELPMVL